MVLLPNAYNLGTKMQREELLEKNINTVYSLYPEPLKEMLFTWKWTQKVCLPSVVQAGGGCGDELNV